MANFVVFGLTIPRIFWLNVDGRVKLLKYWLNIVVDWLIPSTRKPNYIVLIQWHLTQKIKRQNVNQGQIKSWLRNLCFFFLYFISTHDSCLPFRSFLFLKNSNDKISSSIYNSHRQKKWGKRGGRWDMYIENENLILFEWKYQTERSKKLQLKAKVNK